MTNLKELRQLAENFPTGDWATADVFMDRTHGAMTQIGAEFIAASSPTTVLALLDQIDAMKPVVDAAVAYINAPDHANHFAHFRRVENAVRTYQGKEK